MYSHACITIMVQPGPALSRCNRCSCIGPRASAAPRHYIWVDYSFLPDISCPWEFSRNAIYISFLTRNELSSFYLAIINIQLEIIEISARTPWHWRNRKVVESMTLLRPVAQLYGQVRTDWNQCIVIDCSLSHPAGHKPFTCSHSVLRTTWLNIHAVLWMRFSSRLSVHVFTISLNLTWAFFVSSAVSELSSARSINCFLRHVCCFLIVKDKSPSVLVDKCCRFASLKPVQNSRQ